MLQVVNKETQSVLLTLKQISHLVVGLLLLTLRKYLFAA